jgi:hypothetical protein
LGSESPSLGGGVGGGGVGVGGGGVGGGGIGVGGGGVGVGGGGKLHIISSTKPASSPNNDSYLMNKILTPMKDPPKLKKFTNANEAIHSIRFILSPSLKERQGL